MNKNTLIREHIGCPNKMLKTERWRDFFEAAYLQYYLDTKDYPLVYIDEFHVSMHTEEFYNWSPVNTKALIAVNPSSWTMSFWVALSKQRVEAIIAWSKSINTRIFTWFLGDLSNNLKRDSGNKKPACFIFDNSSVHTVLAPTPTHPQGRGWG